MHTLSYEERSAPDIPLSSVVSARFCLSKHKIISLNAASQAKGIPRRAVQHRADWTSLSLTPWRQISVVAGGDGFYYDEASL